ncbi:MAG: NYN domain-containing protein, partial [Actinomycetota bacterium]|nr:NYN domain-containing protein [Actinomycetota bacterium]
MRANVYVDGFNLYYGSLEGTPPGHKWLDLDALARRLLPRDTVNRIRYFTALITPRPGDDPKKVQRQQTYLRALDTIPNLSIHYGHFKTNKTRMKVVTPPPNTIEVYKTEEKGSDVNIATYMLLDAHNGDCDVAVVISNDSDLKEPVALAQSDMGLKVGVVNPHPAVKRSLDLTPTFFKQLRA